MKKLNFKKIDNQELRSITGGSRRRVRRVGVALRRRRSSGYADENTEDYSDEY
ncbi:MULTISPECIES: bacteriocin [Aquimarina]|uniref:bacteriocin n=1 Tax=Aquimarina TaxID=290174 RepID=UPI000AB83631|nr:MULTISPECIES: bacteriocin [Aquimarina]